MQVPHASPTSAQKIKARLPHTPSRRRGTLPKHIEYSEQGSPFLPAVATLADEDSPAPVNLGGKAAKPVRPSSRRASVKVPVQPAAILEPLPSLPAQQPVEPLGAPQSPPAALPPAAGPVAEPHVTPLQGPHGGVVSDSQGSAAFETGEAGDATTRRALWASHTLAEPGAPTRLPLHLSLLASALPEALQQPCSFELHRVRSWSSLKGSA